MKVSPGNADLTRYFFVCLALVLLVKFSFLLLDPQPQFFWGDSAAYMHSAKTDSFPVDRSYTYGVLIRLLGLRTHSLFPVILFQVMASIASCLALYFICARYLETDPVVALFVTLLFALDPTQLYFERNIMTETVSTCAFMVSILFGLSLLRKFTVIGLVAFWLSGLAAATLRTTLEVAVMSAMLAVPLLMFAKEYMRVKSFQRTANAPSPVRPMRLKDHARNFLIPLLGIFGIYMLLFSFYTGFRSAEIGEKHELQRQVSLLVVASPFLEAEDGSNEKVSQLIEEFQEDDQLRVELRLENHYLPNGFGKRFKRLFQTPDETTAAAKATLANALRRKPLGMFLPGVQGWAGSFRQYGAEGWIRRSSGFHISITDSNRARLLEDYHFLAPDDSGSLLSLTKTMLLRYAQLMYLYAMAPFLLVAALIVTDKPVRMEILFILIVTTVLYGVYLLVAVPLTRYFSNLVFVPYLAVGLILNRFIGASSERPLTLRRQFLRLCPFVLILVLILDVVSILPVDNLAGALGGPW